MNLIDFIRSKRASRSSSFAGGMNPYRNAGAPEKRLVDFRLYLILLVVNCVVFVAMWVKSGYASPDNYQLLDWGADFAPLTLTGEPWRLLTSMFLHANWMHLLMNMYMLFILGSVLERVIGSWRFGAVYLLSGLGGSLSSSFWNGYHKVLHTTFQKALSSGMGMAAPVASIRPVVSMGASGALMGLAGAACVLALRYPEGWPRGANIRIRRNAIVQVIGINLVYGFITSGIDQAAHCGGLLAGAIAAWLLCQGEPCSSFFRRTGWPVIVAVAGSALMFVAAARGQSPELLRFKAHANRERQAKNIENRAAAEERARPAPVAAP